LEIASVTGGYRVLDGGVNDLSSFAPSSVEKLFGSGDFSSGSSAL
jgi:hypothetical protein